MPYKNKEDKRRNMREYRARNVDKIRAAQSTREFREHRSAQRRLRYATDPDHAAKLRAQSKAGHKKHRAKNKESINARNRERYAKDPAKYQRYVKRWTEKNKSRIAAYVADWRKKNRAKCRAASRRHYSKHGAEVNLRHRNDPEWMARHLARGAKRRAREIGALVGDLKDIADYYAHVRCVEKIRCYYCKRPIPKKQRTVDHVIPLCRGGEHSVSNFVPACSRCNKSKAQKLPHEFTGQHEMFAA